MADPTARVLRLLSLLHTYRFWPGTELASRLEVSSRTLRRDIDRLRDLGYAIEATPGVAGGYRLGSGSELPPLLVDDDEAVAIAVGLRAAAGAAVEGIEETSVRALAKLEQVLPARLRRRVGSVYGTVTPMRWHDEGPRISTEALATLALGCREAEQVQFRYEARDGARSSRMVEPHQLVALGRRWYLVAFDVHRDDWRTFRVDRMEQPRLAGTRFEPREIPGGDAAEFVSRSIGSMPVAFETTVVVRGEPDTVAVAARWMDAEMVDATPGACRVHLRSESVGWLASMVAVLAAEYPVEIPGPPALLDRLAALRKHLAAGTAPGTGIGGTA